MDGGRQRPGQEPQRCAFVTYESYEDAKVAIQVLNDVYRFRENAPEPIHVSVAKPRGSGKGSSGKNGGYGHGDGHDREGHRSGHDRGGDGHRGGSGKGGGFCDRDRDHFRSGSKGPSYDRAPPPGYDRSPGGGPYGRHPSGYDRGGMHDRGPPMGYDRVMDRGPPPPSYDRVGSFDRDPFPGYDRGSDFDRGPPPGYDHGNGGHFRGPPPGMYDRGNGASFNGGKGGHDRGYGGKGGCNGPARSSHDRGGYDRGNFDRNSDRGKDRGGSKGGTDGGGRGRDGPPGAKLYVGNLPGDITREAIDMVFSTYGRVDDIHIMTGRSRSGQSCAFVTYTSASEAKSAISAMGVGYEIRPGEGHILVKHADEKGHREGGGGDRGRDRGGDSDRYRPY